MSPYHEWKTKMAGKFDTKPRNESAPVVISDWQRQKEVAELAYEFWRARRFRNGSPEEDLLRADLELRERAETTKMKMGRLFLVRKPGS
jgi:hypothetical protein